MSESSPRSKCAELHVCHSQIHSKPSDIVHGAFSKENSPQNKNIRRNGAVWNDKFEAAAKEIGEMSLNYKLMHIEMAQRAHLKYNILIYMGIILAPISGIISQFNSPFSSCDNMYVAFLSLGISFISGIVIAIIKFSRYDEVEYSNKLAASKYTSLESNVRRQLALYRDIRIDAVDYMEWLSNSFDELFLSSPLLPHNLFEKYRKLALKNGHTPPNQYGNTININEEYEQTIIRNICQNDTIIVNTMNSATSSQNSENNEIEDYCKERKREYVETLKLDKITLNRLEPHTQNQKNKEMKEMKDTKGKDVILDNASLDVETCDSPVFTRIMESPRFCQQENPLKGSKVIKRTETLVPFQELNRYNDAMMKYQIKRLLCDTNRVSVGTSPHKIENL